MHLIWVLINVILKIICIAPSQSIRKLCRFYLIVDVFVRKLYFLENFQVIIEKRDAKGLVDKVSINTFQVDLLETMHSFLVGCPSETTIVRTFRVFPSNSFFEALLTADHLLNSEILHICIHEPKHWLSGLTLEVNVEEARVRALWSLTIVHSVLGEVNESLLHNTDVHIFPSDDRHIVDDFEYLPILSQI